MFYGVVVVVFLQASSVVHALLDLGVTDWIPDCILLLGSFHCSLTIFSSNFCFSFLIPYMKVQQTVLEERLKEEKQQEMVDSPVNMPQVSSHVHIIVLEMLYFETLRAFNFLFLITF